MTETMMQSDVSSSSISSQLLAWARYHLAARLEAMKPEHTTEQVAAAAAISGNPAGF